MQDRDPSRDAQQALIRALARTADARRQQGRHSDAARLYRQALELCDTVLGLDSTERAAIVRGLALIGETQGHQYEKTRKR